MKIQLSVLVLLPFLSLLSCKTIWHSSSYDYQRIEMDDSISTDEEISSFIQPYKDQLDSQMEVEIGICSEELTKERLESSMGNWMADILLEEAQRLSVHKVDFAVQNYGGMRLPSISKGPIRVRTIYELMPFDNMLFIVEADGKIVQRLLDRIADYGGWPISYSVNFEIQNDRARNILINGEPLDSKKLYHFALPDYIANGGDNCDFLVSLEKEDYALLVRDAIINHIKRDSEQEIEQYGIKEGRIKIRN